MIISFDPDAITEYIPEFGGNRDSDDPCVIGIKFVSYSRVQFYSRIISAKTKGTTNPQKMTEITQDVQRKQFMENVESVSGYKIGDREVTDPGELYDTADADLIFELIRAMESSQKLSEGQRKNS